MNYTYRNDGSPLPTSYYNILADLPSAPPPMLHPATHQPVAAGDLARLFPQALIEQEMSTARFIPIPPEVLDVYATYRATPLKRARRLEQELNTPAHIYYKYEGVSPAGSHKPNTAVAQAYYNKREGITRLATETGAGQWGSALSYAGSLFGLEVMVYMVNVSYRQKPYRRTLMETWGGQVVASPSELTVPGRAVRERDPDCPGSLGIAISEAVCDAAGRDDTHYALGSMLNHVLLHQTVIGQEARRQLQALNEYPDVVIGCHGGGSNLGGISLPFIADAINGTRLRVIAAEPASCPTLTRGRYAYDFGDTAGLTPLAPMHTLGHGFIPSGIHAGGLRYHGAAPIISQLVQDGLIEPRAYPQRSVFQAALQFTRTEGILPAPESAHAIRAAIDEAIMCRECGRQSTILFCLSGHGHFDLEAYESYLAGRITDQALDEDKLAAALNELPEVAMPQPVSSNRGNGVGNGVFERSVKRMPVAPGLAAVRHGFVP